MSGLSTQQRGSDHDAFTPGTDAPSSARRAHGRLSFRADIEGLRAVAILFVVLYHTGWRIAAGGYRGVDVFFVLSGFLITGLLLAEAESTKTISLTQFWSRRARRLLPAAAVLTVVVLIVDAIILTPFDQVTVAQSIRAFAVYTSNVFFAAKTTQYFSGGGAHQPMLHTWSLSVEEQFYLLFAPLLLAIAARSAKSGSTFLRRRLAIIVAVLTAVSFAGWLVMLYRYPLISFFILPTRVWELGLGALTVFVVQRPALEGWKSTALAIAGALLLVVSMSFSGTAVQTHGLSRLAPTLGAAALLVSGTSARPTFVARLLATTPMRRLGLVSYDWYLWHWPMLVFLDEVVPNASLATRLFVAALALVPSFVTYRWVTSPIRFSTYLQRHAKLVIGGAVALAGAVLAMTTMAIWHANRLMAAPVYGPIVASREKPAVYDDGCHLTIAEVDEPPCMYGPATNDTTVVLFGDSHAAQWFPAFNDIAKSRGWRLVSMTKSACPSIDVTIWNGQLGREYSECDDWRDGVVERIVAMKPTLVVIANTRAYEIVDGDRRIRTDVSREAAARWSEAVGRTLARIAPSQARVMVIQDNPHPGFDVPTCEAKNIDTPPECDWFRLRGIDTVLAGAERSAVARFPNATYVSLNRVLCEGGRCPAVRNGIVRYMDNNHISVPYARAVAPEMSKLLTQLLAARPASSGQGN
jgi:peptidoglycan/LPS O-acetylase OafA/YrhL